MYKETLAAFFLRVGLATVFLYAAIASFLTPTSWIGFFPGFIPDGVLLVLLILFSLFEIVLALWLLSNRRPHTAAIVSSVTMILIIIFNLSLLDIVFRDIAILLASLALFVLSKKEGKK